MSESSKSSSHPGAPSRIHIQQPLSHCNERQPTSDVPSGLRSPFFRPSNPRISAINTPLGTKRPIVVINNVPLDNEEKKSSMLGAWSNLCNVTIGAGIVGLVRLFGAFFILLPFD